MRKRGPGNELPRSTLGAQRGNPEPIGQSDTTRHRAGREPHDNEVRGKRELRKLQEQIWPGETVERMATRAYRGGLGLLVMTDKRLILLKERTLSSTLEDWTCAAS